jgi:hypothetical protein
MVDTTKKTEAKAPTSTPPPIETQRLLAKGEVSIWIDTYDDIFSDFDPRPYRERALSVDFLDEAKRYAKEKGDKLQVRILTPSAIRNARMEAVVKKRLSEHFKRHTLLVEKDQDGIKHKGWKFVAVGAVILLMATVVMYYGKEGFFKDFFIILLEPAGWFTIWSGFDMVVLDPDNLKADLDFYRKMSTADIAFESY